MRLYWEVARRALQRQLAYRTENLAGLVTNVFFGYLRAAVFVAVYQNANTSSVGGYDAQAAVTYTWVTQAMIMIVALWGWWDVEDTIRSGDVVSDLSKPFAYLGFWLARDLGRGAYFLVFRAVPVLLAGQVTFGLRWPSSATVWLAFLASVMLALVVSFGWRFLLNVSAFWTTDARGLGALANAATLFLGGFVVPIRYFPDWLQPLALALPFAAITQTPADVFVERVRGVDIVLPLAGQVAWAVVLLGCAQLATLLATRRVVIQGG
ncbi:MAG: ABC-2 family transporter protein [Chloroflexota bacterium]|nr:ABC-2 family transporter protein [Chloroflexota bacterium]